MSKGSVIIKYKGKKPLEIKVDDLEFEIHEGLNTDLSKNPPNVEHNGNRRILIMGWVGEKDVLHTESFAMGFR